MKEPVDYRLFFNDTPRIAADENVLNAIVIGYLALLLFILINLKIFIIKHCRCRSSDWSYKPMVETKHADIPSKNSQGPAHWV